MPPSSSIDTRANSIVNNNAHSLSLKVLRYSTPPPSSYHHEHPNMCNQVYPDRLSHHSPNPPISFFPTSRKTNPSTPLFPPPRRPRQASLPIPTRLCRNT